MIPKKRNVETAITINLLVARAASSNKEQIKEETQRMAAAIVQNSNIRISRLDLVYKKEDVEAVLQKNTHDVILMNETIGTDSIGSGSIKSWKKINPRVKLILILPDSKKAGMKISQLYHAGFYNVIFLSDFSGNTLVSLISSERSQEEAREYYGIKEIEESQDIGEMETFAPVAEVAKEINNEDPVKFMEAAAPDLSSEYPDAIQESNTYDIPDQNGVLPEANFTDIDIKTLIRAQAPDVNERKEIKAPWHELPDVPKSNVDEYGHALEKQVSPTFPEAGKVTNQKVYEQDAQSDNHRAYYDNNKEKKKMENVEDTMERTNGNRFRTTTMNPISEVNRMAVSDTKRHLPREYYEEEKMEFFDEDDQVEMPVKKNLPFEPKFAGGKKELPAQFKEINVDPTVSSYGGYVIKPISDTVLLIEVPDAHFLSDVHVQEGELINLITSRL